MINIKNISYAVSENGEEQKAILKDINLSFERGKLYVITGPNGSGKSTLVKILMGIINANSGEVCFENKNINNLSISQRAHLGFSYAFQKPVTFKGITIRKLLNIASGKENNVGEICDYLSLVGLCAKDYIDRPFDDSLSGGEQKRIELALVLAKNGILNIFDEPEAGIDIWSFEKLIEMFKSLKGATNIIVSHQRKVLEIADQIILLDKGEIKEVGSFKEVEHLLFSSSCNRLGGKV